MSDILILGYGPAGVSAALYGLRAGLDVQLVGKDVGALAKAHKIENYFGLKEPMTGAELAEVGKKQALALGAEIVDDEVTDFMFDGFGFVATGLNGTYRGKVCVMATGAARKKTPIPGMAEMEGHGVSYCAVCDAFFYRKKDVAVLGSGEYALHEVNELLSVANSVTLLTNGMDVTATFPDNVRLKPARLRLSRGRGNLKACDLMMALKPILTACSWLWAVRTLRTWRSRQVPRSMQGNSCSTRISRQQFRGFLLLVTARAERSRLP